MLFIGREHKVHPCSSKGLDLVVWRDFYFILEILFSAKQDDQVAWEKELICFVGFPDACSSLCFLASRSSEVANKDSSRWLGRSMRWLFLLLGIILWS